jgi:hypothetical protein
MFDDRIIGAGIGPPRQPDLSICDIYLWGTGTHLTLLKLLEIK